MQRHVLVVYFGKDQKITVSPSKFPYILKAIYIHLVELPC
jgi:hypothetical protein